MSQWLEVYIYEYKDLPFYGQPLGPLSTFVKFSKSREDPEIWLPVLSWPPHQYHPGKFQMFTGKSPTLHCIAWWTQIL